MNQTLWNEREREQGGGREEGRKEGRDILLSDFFGHGGHGKKPRAQEGSEFPWRCLGWGQGRTRQWGAQGQRHRQRQEGREREAFHGTATTTLPPASRELSWDSRGVSFECDR